MCRLRSSLVVFLVGLLFSILGGSGPALAQEQAEGQLHDLRYRHHDIDDIPLPPGISFFLPYFIKNDRKVYGVAFDADFKSYPAYFGGRGELMVVPAQGGVQDVNERGTAGGYVFSRVGEHDATHAALFHGRRIELIPRLPDEQGSYVAAINNAGTAVVFSFGAAGARTIYLYRKGKCLPLPGLNPFKYGGEVAPGLHLNDDGIIAGFIVYYGPSGTPPIFRAFRHDLKTGRSILLPWPAGQPVNETYVHDLNARGTVAGYVQYKNAVGEPGTQRIGLWNRHGRFITYDMIPEGAPQFASYYQLVNDNNLLVESFTLSRAASEFTYTDKTYLLPRPGVKIDLETLVVNAPAGQKYRLIGDLNDRGDMIGRNPVGNSGYMLLRTRRGHQAAEEAAALQATPELRAQRRAAREAALALPQFKEMALRPVPPR